MMTSRDRAILWSDRLRLPQLMRSGPDAGLTTILFHHFRFGDETWEKARERLCRQLHFLTDTFTPISIAEVPALLDGTGQKIKRPLLVTIDDAKRENLEVADIFQSAGVPVTHFICAGWCARSDPSCENDDVKLRLVARLHFWNGPSDTIHLKSGVFHLDTLGNASLIDAIIQTQDTSDLEMLCTFDRDLHSAAVHSEDGVCNWAEVKHLQDFGATIGCHSASHPRIAQQSSIRQHFEIDAAQQCISQKLGKCEYFAYPYGTPDSHNDATRKMLDAEGFEAAFTTKPAVARTDLDPLSIPRFALPDRDMPDSVFHARVRGGGEPLNRLRKLARRGR